MDQQINDTSLPATRARLPLTFQQQWLWRLARENPDWNCILPYILRITGKLNVRRLRESFEAVVHRHGSLRTRIVTVGGTAKQQVDEHPAHCWDYKSVDGASRPQLEANAWRLLEEFADLKTGSPDSPLLRVSLFALSDVEFLLAVGVHRVLADCSSIEQALRELWTSYCDFGYHRPPSLPPKVGQYADYAIWQERSSDEWHRKHESYWRSRLSGAERIRWPIDAHASLTATPRGVGKMSCLFGKALSSELQALARSLRTLPGTVILTTYVAALWRWCNQKDFILPFNIGGRQSEHRSVVGYFSHILYLRIELTADETFSQLLARVSNEFFRALTHQDFGRMAALRPEPLSATFFQWVTWHPQESFQLNVSPDEGEHGIVVQRVSFRDFEAGLSVTPPGLVDVEVNFFDAEEGIRACGFYRAELFTSDTIERFLHTVRSAAQQFVQNPNIPLADVEWADAGAV